ncbi:MAG: glycosyltransferase [Nostocoides sp.]
MKAGLRYWILSTECQPRHLGGIGTYVPLMAQGLRDQGHDVMVVLPNYMLDGRMKVGDLAGVPTVEFNPRHWPDIPKSLGVVARLSLVFSEIVKVLVERFGCPNYIEVQDFQGIGYFVLQRQLTFEPDYPQIPVLVRAHCPSFLHRRYNDDSEFHLPEYWVGEMERFCYVAADAVLVPSDAMERELLDEGLRLRSIRVPNPVDGESIPSDRNRYDGEVVYFSRLQPLKGIIELLDAFQDRFDDAQFDEIVVIGASAKYQARGQELRTFLEDKHSDAVGNGTIKFLGAMDRLAALERLKSAKVVLVPSRFESFGYAVTEAMALHRVVVASKNGGQADYIVDDVNGILFDPDCRSGTSSLSGALERALSLSETERERMGAMAAATVRQLHNPFEVGRRLLEALESMSDPLAARASRRFPVVRPQPQAIETVASNTTNGEVATNMRRGDRLSVVVPCYNLGETLNETVRSVVESTYRPLELIIVDDGSTDPSTIAALYRLDVETSDSLSLRVIHTDNQGLAAARNTGALASTGHYLSFLDADDLVEPTYFARAVEIIDSYENVGFVGSWMQYFEMSAQVFVSWNPEPPFLLYHNMINSSSIVALADTWLAHGRNNPHMFTGMEDYESVVRMVAAGVAGVAIPQKLYHYRVRRNSMSRQFNKANKLLMYERMTELNSAIYTRFAKELTGLLNANGPGISVENPTIISDWGK